MRRNVAAVVGGSDGSAALLAEAEAVGRGLVDAGYRIATGGGSGVMEAASRGARRATAYREGDVIAILPGVDAEAANAYADIVLPTGLGHARNGVLVCSADVVVAIGGGAGTLSEIALAWVHGKPVICLDRGEGWSAELSGRALDARRGDAVLHRAEDADAVIRLARAVCPP